MKKITFFSITPGLKELFPVIPAHQYKPKWVSKARESFKEESKNYEGDKFAHIYRCPGIFDLMKYGYIFTLPFDLTIETNGDKETVSYILPSTDLKLLMGTDPLTAHMDNKIVGFFPPKPWSIKTILKITTPWYIIAPKNLKFLIIPIPYSDNYEFEMAPGILDPGLSSEINFQLHWNVVIGKRTIKAGTPICQIIPISEEKYELEVRDATEKDLKWIRMKRYFFGFSFNFNKNIFKKMYEKWFNLK